MRIVGGKIRIPRSRTKDVQQMCSVSARKNRRFDQVFDQVRTHRHRTQTSERSFLYEILMSETTTQDVGI